MEDDATRPDDRGLTGPPAETTAADGPLPQPPLPEDLERAENLIRQAQLAKIRGDKASFEKLTEEAAALCPGSSTVQEALGDAYIERRQVRKAKDAYHLASRLDPNNASAGRKFGEAVLAVQLALDPTFATAPDDESFASGRAAVVLSLLIPGLGQLVAGNVVKGSVFLAGWLVGWGWSVMIPGGLNGIPSLFGRGPVTFNPAVLLPLFVSSVFWIASIADASARAKSAEPKKIQRPIPPVDKDFEL